MHDQRSIRLRKMYYDRWIITTGMCIICGDYEFAWPYRSGRSNCHLSLNGKNDSEANHDRWWRLAERGQRRFIATARRLVITHSSHTLIIVHMGARKSTSFLRCFSPRALLERLHSQKSRGRFTRYCFEIKQTCSDLAPLISDIIVWTARDAWNLSRMLQTNDSYGIHRAEYKQCIPNSYAICL